MGRRIGSVALGLANGLWLMADGF